MKRFVLMFLRSVNNSRSEAITDGSAAAGSQISRWIYYPTERAAKQSRFTRNVAVTVHRTHTIARQCKTAKKQQNKKKTKVQAKARAVTRRNFP